MLEATYVRPDRITRTSVLEPTAEGYQPVRAAQGVATQFTEIYGPTIWGTNPRPTNALGQTCSCPVAPSAVHTSKGAMQAVGVKTASTNEEAMATIAHAFAMGQSIRMRDRYGRVVVAHPDEKTRHPFWSNIINKARALADRIIARRGRRGPLWQKPRTPQIELQPPAPRPGAIPVTYGWVPQFNRPQRAADKVLGPSTRAPQSIYLPEQAGGRKLAPHMLTAEVLAHRFPQDVPRMVKVRGQANALDWFHREGRYY